MTQYYESHSRFFVSVDCIIFGLKAGRLSVLLTRRAFEPERGKWSLMGGFVEDGESVDESARRVVSQLTGLDNVYMHQVGAFGRVDRDPGERVISVAYFVLLNTGQVDDAKLRAHGAYWRDLDDLPELGFDHPEMIHEGRGYLRQLIQVSPLAYRLLPELFTLTQVQTLYELILGTPVDKRNFRKHILESGYVVPTEIIDKSTSRRGARMYRFAGDKNTNNYA